MAEKSNNLLFANEYNKQIYIPQFSAVLISHLSKKTLMHMSNFLSNDFDYEACRYELFMYAYTMGANNNVFRNI